MVGGTCSDVFGVSTSGKCVLLSGEAPGRSGLPAQMPAQSRRAQPCYCRRLIEITECPTFSDEEAALLSAGEPDPYGTDHLDISWAPKDHHVCFSEAGRLVAHAGYVLIDVDADGVQLSGVGLGGVMVHPSLRGQGVGARLVQETTDRMAMTGRPFALLFCREVRLPFYRRLGWHLVGPEVSVEQDQGQMTMPLLTCWFSLARDSAAPSHRLRVLGPPF